MTKVEKPQALDESVEPTDWSAVVRALGPQIRASRHAIEQDRQLPRELVETLAATGLFRLATPRALKGFELDPATTIRVYEDLARIDSATGWSAMIGNSGMFTGSLRLEAGEEIYRDNPNAIIGSQSAPIGRAVVVPGGFRVSGRWPFASGVEHSDWMILAGVVYDGDQPRASGTGKPEIHSLFVPRGSFEVLDTWCVGGLRGTGSHDVVVRDQFVPCRLSYLEGDEQLPDRRLDRAGRVHPVLAACVAGVGLGIARGAMDALFDLVNPSMYSTSRQPLRDRHLVQLQVAEAQMALRSARALLYEILDRVWAEVAIREPVSAETRALLQGAATFATASAAKAVDLLYTAGGSGSLYTRNRIERAFRDIHACGQHAGIRTDWYDPVGRVLLGMEADTSL